MQIKNPANNGYTNGGFTSAALSVPPQSATVLPQTVQNTTNNEQQTVNFQSICTIQCMGWKLTVCCGLLLLVFLTVCASTVTYDWGTLCGADVIL